MKRLFILLLGLVLTMPIDSTLNATEPMETAPQSTSNGWEEIGEVQIYEETGKNAGTKQYSGNNEGRIVGRGTIYYKYLQGVGRMLKIYYNGSYYTLNRIMGHGYRHLYKNDGSQYGTHIATVHYYFNVGEKVYYIPFNPNQL